jgi:PPOX class probable F420-dependent enzyme
MLPETLRDLCKGNNFGALTTLFPSGNPQTQLVWVDCDDDHVIINTERHRAKFQNMERDPRVSIAIWDNDDPYRFIEVRGRVVKMVGGESARAYIDELSQQYKQEDYPLEIISERMTVWIKPERLSGYG